MGCVIPGSEQRTVRVVEGTESRYSKWALKFVKKGSCLQKSWNGLRDNVCAQQMRQM